MQGFQSLLDEFRVKKVDWALAVRIEYNFPVPILASLIHTTQKVLLDAVQPTGRRY